MSEPKKKKKVNAAPPGRKGHQLPARVEDDLWEALQAEAHRERRRVAPMVVILLEEALAARGKWPPPAAPDDAE